MAQIRECDVFMPVLSCEQFEVLTKIGALGDGEAEAAQEILLRLRARPDVLGPTVVEIVRRLAKEPKA